MPVKIKNKSSSLCRAWITSQDAFSGSTDWYDISPGGTETWDRDKRNTITVDFAGQEYKVTTSGSDTLIIKNDGIYRDGVKNCFQEFAHAVASRKAEAAIAAERAKTRAIQIEKDFEIKLLKAQMETLKAQNEAKELRLQLAELRAQGQSGTAT